MPQTVVRTLRDAILGLLALITVTSTTGMEFQSSTTLLLTGLFALNPWLTNLVPSIPFQGELLSLMPEWAWGITLTSLGAMQAWANLNRRSQPRMVCAFLAASVFGSWATLAALVRPVSLFLPFLIAASLSQAISFLVMSLARFRVITPGGRYPRARPNV